MGALRAGRLEAAVVGDADPERLVAVGVARGRGAEGEAQWSLGGGVALERLERRAGEEGEGHQGGDRVAGQAEDERVVAGAEPGRLARAQSDAPETLLDAEA